MSDEQSIREDLAAALREIHVTDNPGWRDDADMLLASPVIRRIQAEAVRQSSLRFQMWLNTGGPTPGTEFLDEMADRIERGETT